MATNRIITKNVEMEARQETNLKKKKNQKMPYETENLRICSRIVHESTRMGEKN